jgi:SAM-dependent methyltransferase
MVGVQDADADGLNAGGKGCAMSAARPLIVALVIALAAGCGTPAAIPPPAVSDAPKIDVIWVPSDVVVVRKMLQMARVGRDDVVYDLGSGDGRIVIMAAREFGARGVGVDIDPGLIAKARENAVKAGVADRVTFVEQDLFTADISQATVVAIYLSQDVNMRLRPKLRRELRPGSRIVSHDYDLGDWAAEETATVPFDNRDHLVFLWRVPAR